jgi:predicted phosphoribosyltransferase
MRFHDRRDAGRALAERLTAYANRSDVVVLALPRGGVPVAYEVALVLHASLDVFLVRKLGVPEQPELAMGALASGDTLLINTDVVNALGIPDHVIDAVALEERQELERRERAYRDDRPPVDVRGRVVILVDDGLATGSSMRAAVAAVQQQRPTRVVVAVPVGSAATCADLQGEVDEVVCALTPQPFFAVGQWYEDFTQTSDAEVHELLDRGAHAETGPAVAEQRYTRTGNGG